MKAGNLIPIFRIFDEYKALEYYIDFLGFKVDWEHRFSDEAPLYMQISMDECIIHLSEHYGDACPGSAIRIEYEGLEEYNKILLNKNYKYYRPGIEKTPWETYEMSLKDPFGNRLIFYKQAEA